MTSPEGSPGAAVRPEPVPPADGTGKPPGEALLTVTGLTKHFPVTRGIIFRHTVGLVRSVEDVSFSVAAGETLGIVGESGCGKTTTARMIVRLIEPTSGQITFDGHDITHLRQGAMRPLRRDIQMIFQDPYSSLNPRHTVGTIVGAPYRLQKVTPEKGIRHSVQELLELVGLNPEHYNRYPHEFSGGQRQRIGIARTLALRPKLIIADEPVSALDVRSARPSSTRWIAPAGSRQRRPVFSGSRPARSATRSRSTTSRSSGSRRRGRSARCRRRRDGPLALRPARHLMRGLKPFRTRAMKRPA